MTKADDDARKNTFLLFFSALLFCCCSNSNYWCLYWYSPSLHFLFLLLCVASASEVAAAVYAAPHRPVTAVRRRSAVACAACGGGAGWRARRARLACTASARRPRRVAAPAAPATSTFPKGARKQGTLNHYYATSSAALFACLPLPITMWCNNFWRWVFLVLFLIPSNSSTKYLFCLENIRFSMIKVCFLETSRTNSFIL